MKLLKYIFPIVVSLLLASCSSSDDDLEDLTGQTGEVVLKFDNGVGDQDFIFGTEYAKSNDESFKLTNLKYIISNVEFTDNEGNTFMYPTEDNVFIIDEENGNNAGEIWVTLDGVDAADYVSVSFGVGIDQSRFALGADGQGDFLELASEAGMMWSWATGYKFIRLDGTCSTATSTDEALNVHMGSVGTSLDNYREVTLEFPNSLIVREETVPEVHIKADIAKVWDGTTVANFEDGYHQVHTSETLTPVIADNVNTMFEVHHVHND